MEEKKKIKLSTIILIILIILSFVAVGVALYKLNESNTKIAELYKEINTINQNKNIIENKTNNVENNTTNDYTTFATNAEKAIKSLGQQDGYEFIIQREVFLPSEDEGARFGYYGAYIDGNDNAYIRLKHDSDLYSKYGNEYKVDENVLSLYVALRGNGGFYDIIFIKKDGTVDIVSTVNGKEIKCEKLENVKNAVTVIPYNEEGDMGTGAYSYLILDINGNVVKK